MIEGGLYLSSIVLGCDSNGVHDANCQNTVAKILEKAGHSVEKLRISSGAFADYSYYNKKGKGKIGVYLMADSITSVADAYDGNIVFKYTYFIVRGDLGLPRMKTQQHFQNNPIGKDRHGDCRSASCNRLAGKTYPQMNEIIKSKCKVIFGTTPTEMGNNLVKELGGGDTASSSKNNSSSYGSCKEALTDVLYNWDGEVECFIRDDTVYVRKIPSPSTATLSLIEGQNIDLNSVNITDYNPSTVNHLSATFKDYTLSIQDDYLIKRFGKILSTVKMDKSIKKLDDAKKFLQREWNKLKRDNGHSLECKTFGHTQWKTGEWCRVYLPSFNIDDYMYITKVSQDDSGDSEWSCNLTLVDYPPGFGEPTNNNQDDSKSEDSQ